MDKLMKHIATTQWAKQILNQSEINTAIIAETPWSTVLKVSAGQDSFYLKQTPADLFIEVDVIQKLRELCGITDIPEIIAVNKNMNCFLMRECGDVSLRTVFAGNLNVDLLSQGLKVYKKLQLATTKHLNAFLQIGVPDWRLTNFPKLYENLIADKTFLQAHGINTEQVEILHHATIKVERLCEELANYAIPECLNHSDFHDNNMLYNFTTKKISIIDLGETAINHPFFSLAAFLMIPGNFYNIKTDSTEYEKLFDICFSGWSIDKKSMLRIIEIINILLPIYLLFAQKRFLDAINLPYNANNPISVKQHNKINQGFVWFIKNLNYDF